MARFILAPTRRLTALLLGGLLTLLLWGQCGSELYPRSDNQRPTLIGQVSRTDSLPSARLYLTLYLRNNTSQPIVLQEVAGVLRYQGRAFPFTATAQLRYMPLASGQYIQPAVAIAVPLPPDSLRSLRYALRAVGYRADAPRLDWRATFTYSGSPGEPSKGNTSQHIPTLH